jgi:hypothetical protein
MLTPVQGGHGTSPWPLEVNIVKLIPTSQNGRKWRSKPKMKRRQTESKDEKQDER